MQHGTFNDIDALGKELSRRIGCVIRRPAYGMNVLVCKCGVFFSISRLRTDNNWSWAEELHREHGHTSAEEQTYRK